MLGDPHGEIAGRHAIRGADHVASGRPTSRIVTTNPSNSSENGQPRSDRQRSTLELACPPARSLTSVTAPYALNDRHDDEHDGDAREKPSPPAMPADVLPRRPRFAFRPPGRRMTKRLRPHDSLHL